MERVVARGIVLTPDGPVAGEVVAVGSTISAIRPLGGSPAGSSTGSAGSVGGGSMGGRVRWVCPGFIDTQINGSHGIDLARHPERLPELADRLPTDGVTAFTPTVVTCADGTRDRVIAALERQIATSTSTSAGARRRAVPLGVHLEGPVISDRRRGAHPAAFVRHPGGCVTNRWAPANGVAMVTLAPELPGATELIAELVSVGVVVALGHTDATAEEFQAGLDAGATHVTHLFNAMRPFGHRDPGPVGLVLADDTVTAGLICDGIHVDPVAVRMAWRSLGPDRLVLVTDAVAARGTGHFPAGVRTADGVLAGSALALDEAVRNLTAMTGASVPDAVRTVTATPARVLGLADRGVLAPGARADVTVLDHDLRVVETHVGGLRVR